METRSMAKRKERQKVEEEAIEQQQQQLRMETRSMAKSRLQQKIEEQAFKRKQPKMDDRNISKRKMCAIKPKPKEVLPVASFVNQTPPVSPILTAPYDALELVFDYISLGDLCAVGLTCKRLQQVAGLYFRLYYPQINVRIYICGVHVEQTISGQETNLACHAKGIDIWDSSGGHTIELIHYIERLKNKHLKYISFPILSGLSKDRARCLADTMKSVETVHLKDDCNGIEHVLSLCLKLKCLKIDSSAYNWPLQSYPTLEQLHFGFFRENNLEEILKQNPQIKMINIEVARFNDVMNIIEKAQVQLDELDIYSKSFEKYKMVQLNDFHARGYCKKLKMRCVFFVYNLSQEFFDNLHIIDNLKTLDIILAFASNYDELMGSIAKIHSLSKLQLVNCESNECIEELSVSLMNLDELILYKCSLNTIAPLVRNLPKLKKLRICHNKMDLALNAQQMNRERDKLPAPRRKLTIYLDGPAFLKARWANVDLNSEWIEIRRLTEDIKSK